MQSYMRNLLELYTILRREFRHNLTDYKNENIVFQIVSHTRLNRSWSDKEAELDQVMCLMTLTSSFVIIAYE